MKKYFLTFAAVAIAAFAFLFLNGGKFAKNIFKDLALLSKWQLAGVQSPFVDLFSANIVLAEEGSMSDSASASWWLNSGAYFYIKNGYSSTIQGPLPKDDPWRIYYEGDNTEDTDGGYYPQNIFRLVTRTKWQDLKQEVYYKITKHNLSASTNRNQSNGLLLFNRYQNGDNLYYTGIRVDGTSVIKKKKNGNYYTLAQEKVFNGAYDASSNPNLIPQNVWIGLRSEVSTSADGTVDIKLYMDNGKTGSWALIAQAKDNNTSYGGSAITAAGYGGIRTDFMDVQFSDYKIEEVELSSSSSAVSSVESSNSFSAFSSSGAGAASSASSIVETNFSSSVAVSSLPKSSSSSSLAASSKSSSAVSSAAAVSSKSSSSSSTVKSSSSASAKKSSSSSSVKKSSSSSLKSSSSLAKSSSSSFKSLSSSSVSGAAQSSESASSSSEQSHGNSGEHSNNGNNNNNNGGGGGGMIFSPFAQTISSSSEKSEDANSSEANDKSQKEQENPIISQSGNTNQGGGTSGQSGGFSFGVINISEIAQDVKVELLSGKFAVGMNDERVEILQNMLAKDPEIYPEGKVTGFYGPATVRAVQRFQKKYGLVGSGTPDTTGFGLAGPKTREKLNEVFGATSSNDTSSSISNVGANGPKPFVSTGAYKVSDVSNMTPEQKESLIKAIRVQIDELLKKVIELMSAKNQS
ncbi:MAG: peptidoglycan-binding protein [Candidatus Pacebacteria bacterium]|nr:peptidoglycan-binding protein [Candidatus Paceibacterota bacterium]